jgi:2'-5' RNA ligase
MAKIAADVVLLPAEEVMDKVIDANRQLPNTFSSRIILNKDDCLPHISLAMGCIEEKNIGQIEKILQDVAKEYFPNELKIVGVYIGTDESGRKVSLYHVEKTLSIQSLHEKIMEKLSPYFSYDVTKKTVLAEGRVAESTLRWIKNFPAESSFEKFFPHITIGFGETKALDLPIEFAPVRLALCHMGNHCTCKKILALIKRS